MVIRPPSPRRRASWASRSRAISETSIAVTGRPLAAASRALPDGPQARSATGPSGSGSDKARTASGCGSNEAPKPPSYLAFHRSRSG
jgi:hypothetical protein